jgi:hypothetical protein
MVLGIAAARAETARCGTFVGENLEHEKRPSSLRAAGNSHRLAEVLTPDSNAGGPA